MGMGRPIVIVDDEQDILEVLGSVLQDEGYAVVCADRPSAIAVREQTVLPSLFFLDLMLPEMSGIELARTLRGERFRDTPMVAMSASLSMLEAASASQLFQGTLAKPFDLDVLLDFAQLYAMRTTSTIA